MRTPRLPSLAEPRPALAAGVLATALAALAAPPLAAQNVVVEAGRVVVSAEQEIENGVVVIRDGRITAVGVKGEVEVPWDATVYGGPDHVAFPGFVEAHSNRGMDRPNESLDVAPFLDVRDSIDPVNLYFEDCRRWGITTVNVQQGHDTVVAARGRIVKPHGMTVESMTVRPLYGLKLSASPKRGKSLATQAQALRAAFDDLRAYLEEIVADARQGGDLAKREALYQGRELEGEKAEGRAMQGTAWKVEGLELIPRGAIDEKQEPLLDLIEGRYAAFVYCGGPREVHTALDVARANGFLERTVLVLGAACWKAADVVAEAGVPVVLEAPLVHTERDPLTGEPIETFVPGVFQKAGVRFALSSENSSSGSLWFQAGRAIALGLDRQVALDAVTRTAADVLGLGEEVGSLEVGKQGNVLLLTGDPLSVDTWVDHVILEGVHVYDRSTDTRNEYVYEGEEPVGAAPTDGEGDTGGDPQGN